MQVAAIIPARGGSVGVARKNVRLVGGRPLIAWTIESALAASELARVVVSTDDQEIAAVARACGADVPVLRPSELARADTPAIPVLLHMARWLADHGSCPADAVMMLNPTTPLRTAADIDASVRLMVESGADSVISVTPAAHHPAWTMRIDADGSLVPYLGGREPVPVRQALDAAYALNGAVFLVRTRLLLERQTFYGDCVRAYVMPPERSLDIDTEWDLTIADLLLSRHSPRE